METKGCGKYLPSFAAFNMTPLIPRYFFSIRFKFAAAIFVVLGLSIAFAMVGLWTFQRDQLVKMINEDANRSGLTIEKALRVSMKQNDKTVIKAAIAEIAASYEPPSCISIIGLDGRVAVSSEPALRGQSFDRFTSPSCTGCHRYRNKSPEEKPILLDGVNGPLLRKVIKIKNTPECYQCHAINTEILGVMVYDVYLSRTYDLLKTVAFRMFLTGLATFLIIALILVLTINRLINKPLHNFMQGFVEVGKGNYDFWVDEESSIEFAEMATQFNVMNQAISRFLNEIKAKNQETALLYNIVQEVSETIEWEQLKKIVINLLHDIFKAEQTGLVVPHQKEKDCLDIIWRRGDEKRLAHLVYSPDTPELTFLAVTPEELVEWQRDKYFPHSLRADYQRVLIPLHYNQETLGLICIKKMAGQRFSRHELAIIPALANHISIAMANSHLYHMAITDGLTDLYSKRHLLNKLDMMVARNDKYGNESFFVLILDIDHFKQVNDTYGHEVGDQVLIQLADLLRRNIRFGDIPFRYGGEEFVILVPTVPGVADLDTLIAERIRVAVEMHTFACQDAPPFRLTISLGTASFPSQGRTAHEIVRVADAALYRAKHNGRNQVCRATDIPES